jgi:predicted TIM-barrel fold metal-dependent hydrolase
MPLLADKYPDMKLIIAHLDSKEHIDAIANARHENIYADTSASGIGINNILEYAVNCVGSEKLIFGTDTYSYAYQFGRIALANISFEAKENILWKNAMKLFDKAFK